MAKKKSFKSQAASLFFENTDSPKPEEITIAQAPAKKTAKSDVAEKDVYTHTYTHTEESTESTSDPRRSGSIASKKTPSASAQFPPLHREMKTRRVQLLLRPSTHKAMQAIAQTHGTSLNDLVNAVLEDYIRKK